MIDTHCHILSGIDDGAHDIAESIAMAKIAVKDGISAIIATPHVMSGVYNNSKDQIISAVQDLNKILADENIPLTILPGAEYHIEPDLPRRMEKGELLTLNNTGRYLLVEPPSTYIPDYTGKILYELQLQGITPVIAHPERNAAFAKDPSLLAQFVSRGIPAQVTAGSVTGNFGKYIQKTALNFLKKGLVHMIVSDAHSKRGRIPTLSPAVLTAKQYLTADLAHRLVYENPHSICSAENISLPEISINNKKPWTNILSSLFLKNKA